MPRVRAGAWGWPLMIAAAVAACYANSLTAPFIFDDLYAIVHNPFIRDPSPFWRALSAPPSAQPIVQRPIIALSLSLNYALGKLDVRGYHLFNVLIHLLASLTLVGLVRRTLRLPAVPARLAASADGCAGAVALLWAVHPLLTESVTYVTQRTESVMGLCYLAALYGLVRAHTGPSPRRWGLASVAACAVGMGSKHAMVTAPLAALLYDRTFLSSSAREALRRRPAVYAGLAGTWLLLALLIVRGPAVHAVGLSLLSLTFAEYLLMQARVIVHYLRLAAWPHPLVLAYEWPILRDPRSVLPAAGLVLGLIATVGVGLRRRATIAFLGAWVLLTLAPTSLWPMVTEVAAERRMYLPLAGLVCAVVLLGDTLTRRLASSERQRRALAAGLVATATLLLVAMTVRRNHDYRSAVAIWTDTVAKSPRSARARANLGNALLAEGRVDEAIAQFRLAIDAGAEGWVPRGPGTPLLYYNLGVALAQKRELTQAVEVYRQALVMDPSLVDVRNNLALALADLDRPGEAIHELEEAVARWPDDAGLAVNLGNLYGPAGALGKAEAAYRRALALDPSSLEARNNLGVLLARQGRHRDALTQLRAALVQAPGDPQVRGNIGIVLAEQGRLEEAVTHFRHAAALAPRDPEWPIRLGVALAELGRLADAQAAFAEALRRDPKNAQAAAYLKETIHRRGSR